MTAPVALPSTDQLREWARNMENMTCWGLAAVADELDRLRREISDGKADLCEAQEVLKEQLALRSKALHRAEDAEKYARRLHELLREASAWMCENAQNGTDMAIIDRIDAALAKNPATRPFSELREQMSPEAQERAAAGTKRLVADLPPLEMWRKGDYFKWVRVHATSSDYDGIYMGEEPDTPLTILRTELGCAGHLIVADRCRWRRHTQVGSFRISTVGDYHPDRKGPRETVGGSEDAFFETMVFPTSGVQDLGNEGCGCHEVDDYSGLECERYATAGEAQAGHERYVAKYGAPRTMEIPK